MYNFKVDFSYEALALMDKIIHDDNDEEIFNKFLNNLKNSSLEHKYQNYKVFKEKIVQEIGIINADISLYFNNFVYQGPFIIHFYRFMQTFTSDNISQGIIAYFLECFNELNNQDLTTLDLSSFLAIVNNLDLNDQSKLMAINFFINGETIYKQVLEEVDRIAKIIEKYFSFVKNDYEEYLKEIGNINLRAKLNELLQFNYFKNDDFQVIVSLFYYNHLILQKSEKKFNIYLGYLVFLMKALKEQLENDNKGVLNYLKTISETTRFKILKLLKKRPMYAQEIAKEVGLTSATLVHHLEVLLNEKLIEIVKNNNDKKRIFYQVNKNTIAHFLKVLEENLQ